jgi:hypothetical protein
MPDMGVSSTPEIPPIIIHHNGVMKLLTSLNPHKATGPDSIPGRLLKETAKEITPALTFIFQACIELRVKYVGLGCTVAKGKSITFQWFNSTSIILLVFDVIPEEFWTGFFATFYVVNI